MGEHARPPGVVHEPDPQTTASSTHLLRGAPNALWKHNPIPEACCVPFLGPHERLEDTRPHWRKIRLMAWSTRSLVKFREHSRYSNGRALRPNWPQNIKHVSTQLSNQAISSSPLFPCNSETYILHWAGGRKGRWFTLISIFSGGASF